MPKPLPSRLSAAASLLAIAGTMALSAAEQTIDPALQQRLDALEQQIHALQAHVQQSIASTASLKQAVGKLQGDADVDNGFAWGGFAEVGISGERNAGRSTAIAFNPILIYSYRDEWLATAELNIEMGDAGASDVGLGQAFISATMLPHAIVSAGLMPMPFSTYSERYSPGWINKLVNLPPAPYNEDFGLFASDITDEQIQARGVVDLEDGGRLTWHAFVADGPRYNSDDGSDDRLTFGANNGTTSKPPTVGGRLAYIPMPGAEIGVSAMTGSITNTNVAEDPDAKRRFTSVAVDAEHHLDSMLFRAEWVMLDYDDSVGNRIRSQAGYVQASDHLTQLAGWLSGFEPVARLGLLRRNQEVNGYQDVTSLGGGLNYYHTNYIRSSLMAETYAGSSGATNDARDLSRISLTTTFAF